MTAAMSVGLTMSDAITALVAEKRAVGYKYDAEARVLARFEAFHRREFPGTGALTEASVQAWIVAARRRGVQPATLQGLAALHVLLAPEAEGEGARRRMAAVQEQMPEA